MSRLLTVTYGAASYVVFLAAFLYAIGFVGNIAVPRSIDHGVAAPIGEAIVVNVLLLGAFVQLEERDLTAALGDQYRAYRKRVPILVPGLHRRGTVPDSSPRPT